jgi:hypothetical protein
MTTVAGAHDALPPSTPAAVRDADVAQHKSNGERSALVFVRFGSLERHESAIVGYRIDVEAATRALAV